MVPIRTQCRTQALFLDQSTISLSGATSIILYFLYGCTLQRTESDFCENGGGCLEVNDFYPIFHFMNNPPRPLASGRVDVWLCASVPPQPLPVPPIYDHQGEGNPPLPLPAGPGSARCWRLAARGSPPRTLLNLPNPLKINDSRSGDS